MRSLTFSLLISAAGISAAFAIEANIRVGQDAFGSWRDDAPGVIRKITPEDLPPAAPNLDAANAAQPVPRPDGTMPKLPAGYSAELLVKDIENPRVLRVAPNGDLFVADSKANQVRVFRLGKNGAAVETSRCFCQGLAPALWHRLLSAKRRNPPTSTLPTATASCAIPTRMAISPPPARLK
jgi:glucose/arabinose dehydrogenase